jgi:hypothetical protein
MIQVQEIQVMKAAKSKSMTELFQGFMPPREEQFFSVGAACQLMQINPGQLQVLMGDCGVRFVRMMDAVPYLDADGLESCAERCRQLREEIEQVAESVGTN